MKKIEGSPKNLKQLEYRGPSYCGDRFGKQYYKIIYCGITNEDSVPYGN